jgi:hypothetical protein
MIEVIIIISVIFAVLLVLYKFKVLTDDDNDMIPDEIEVIAEEIHDEVLSRVENIKAEAKDVKKAAKNLAKQTGDVFEAAAGSKRKGRK